VRLVEVLLLAAMGGPGRAHDTDFDHADGRVIFWENQPRAGAGVVHTRLCGGGGSCVLDAALAAQPLAGVHGNPGTDQEGPRMVRKTELEHLASSERTARAAMRR